MTRTGPLSCEDLLDLRASGALRLAPEAPLTGLGGASSAAPSWDRAEGMILGLAIGDALGNTSESLLPGPRRARYGEVRDYLPNRYAAGRAVGLPSDDTQLAVRILETLLEDGELVPDRLADRFLAHPIFGMGRTVRQFLSRWAAGVRPWHAAAVESAGNGALMRVAPVLLPHLRTGGPQLVADAIVASALTHNDRASTASCVAFVLMLHELMGMNAAPRPSWWVDRFVELASPLEGATTYRPRKPGLAFEGPVWRFTRDHVARALEAGEPVVAACDRWYSGAYVLETVPSVLYILARHASDPEEALVRAVNDTRDNDTVAAIVGAAVGALHGAEALPKRWRESLLGRTRETDDGRLFELLASARRVFGEETSGQPARANGQAGPAAS